MRLNTLSFGEIRTMKSFAFCLCCLIVQSALKLNAQQKTPADFGFRHLQMGYQGDTVDILVKSKPNEESTPKPLFLFCQGSLPQPLIKYDEAGPFGVFTFNPDSLTSAFHVAVIGKPGVPVVAHVNTLGESYTYRDSIGAYPHAYTSRNHLDYYVNRNIEALQFLRKQKWTSHQMLVVAGHSEGSTIAAKMAVVSPVITHLIYSGGNPMGRISTLISRARANETDSSKQAEALFQEWQQVVADPKNTNGTGDTFKATYDYSIPPLQYLLKLKIPVLVSYGTSDSGAPFNDYLRIETIRQRKTNFTFNAYIKTEHNYFPVLKNGDIDYNAFTWDRVAEDWRKWLTKH
jgi:pimeloyl-ACP methyl ester carboxylesterase